MADRTISYYNSNNKNNINKDIKPPIQYQNNSNHPIINTICSSNLSDYQQQQQEQHISHHNIQIIKLLKSAWDLDLTEMLKCELIQQVQQNKLNNKNINNNSNNNNNNTNIHLQYQYQINPYNYNDNHWQQNSPHPSLKRQQQQQLISIIMMIFNKNHINANDIMMMLSAFVSSSSLSKEFISTKTTTTTVGDSNVMISFFTPCKQYKRLKGEQQPQQKLSMLSTATTTPTIDSKFLPDTTTNHHFLIKFHHDETDFISCNKCSFHLLKFNDHKNEINRITNDNIKYNNYISHVKQLNQDVEQSNQHIQQLLKTEQKKNLNYFKVKKFSFFLYLIKWKNLMIFIKNLNDTIIIDSCCCCGSCCGNVKTLGGLLNLKPTLSTTTTLSVTNQSKIKCKYYQHNNDYHYHILCCSSYCSYNLILRYFYYIKCWSLDVVQQNNSNSKNKNNQIIENNPPKTNQMMTLLTQTKKLTLNVKSSLNDDNFSSSFDYYSSCCSCCYNSFYNNVELVVKHNVTEFLSFYYPSSFYYTPFSFLMILTIRIMITMIRMWMMIISMMMMIKIKCLSRKVKNCDFNCCCSCNCCCNENISNFQIVMKSFNDNNLDNNRYSCNNINNINISSSSSSSGNSNYSTRINLIIIIMHLIILLFLLSIKRLKTMFTITDDNNVLLNTIIICNIIILTNTIIDNKSTTISSTTINSIAVVVVSIIATIFTTSTIIFNLNILILIANIILNAVTVANIVRKYVVNMKTYVAAANHKINNHDHYNFYNNNNKNDNINVKVTKKLNSDAADGGLINGHVNFSFLILKQWLWVCLIGKNCKLNFNLKKNIILNNDNNNEINNNKKEAVNLNNDNEKYENMMNKIEKNTNKIKYSSTTIKICDKTKNYWIKRSFISYFLMAIIIGCCSAATKQEVPTNCTFPQKWEGSWFLSGSQQSVHIKGSLFSYRGRCMASDGNKYLIVGESGCHRCLVIYEKHTNVLQYKESECDGDSYYMDQNNNYNNPAAMPIRSIINSDRVGGAAHPNSRFSSLDPCMGSYDDPSYCKGREILRNLCDQIPGDAQLYSLFREQAEPVKCPLRGPYTFTYNRGHGECRNPVSNIDSCTEESRLLLSFQACPDVQGTESTVEELTCLATWKDGNSRYLVGLVSHHHAITNEDRFRCFVYEKISTMIGGFQNQNNNPSLKDAEYKLAQSGDATCNGLDSAEVGSRIMTLRKPAPTERCDFPVWLKGPRHWYSLKGNFGYQFHSSDGSMHITRPNGYTDTRAFCEQINKQTLNEMTAVVHFTSGCKKGFMCMSFYRRDINIAEIQMGQPASRLEDACLPDHFDVARMSYVTLLASNSETSKCPTDGLYHLLGAIGPPNLISRHKRNHNNNNNNHNNNHYYNGLYGENIYGQEKQQQHGHHQYHHHAHHPHHQHNHHHNQHYYYNNNNQELKGHKRHDLINQQIILSQNDNADTKNVILSHQNTQKLIPLTDAAADSMAIRNRRFIERNNLTNFINDNTLSNHTTTLNNSLNSNAMNNSNNNKNHNSNDNNSNIGDIKPTLANVNKFEHSSKNINTKNENHKTITTAPVTDDNELQLLHKSKNNNYSESFSSGNPKTTNSIDNQMILESSTISNNNNQLNIKTTTTSNVINTVIDKVNTTTLNKLNASNEPSNEEKLHHVEGQHAQLQKHENYNNHSYSTEHHHQKHHKHYNHQKHHPHHHHQHSKHTNLSKHHKINYQSNNHDNHYHQEQQQQQHEKYRDLKYHVHKQHTAAYNDINDANSNQHSHHRQQSITAATTTTIETEKNVKKSIEIYNEFEHQQQQPQRNRRDVPGCTVNYKIQRELRIGCTDSNQIDVRPQCSDDNEVYICYGSWTENMNTYIVARNLGTQRLICLTYIPFIGNQAKLVIGDECYYHSYEKQSDHLIMTNITRFGQCGDSSNSVKLKFNQLLIYLLPMMLIITMHLMHSIR